MVSWSNKSYDIFSSICQHVIVQGNYFCTSGQGNEGVYPSSVTILTTCLCEWLIGRRVGIMTYMPICGHFYAAHQDLIATVVENGYVSAGGHDVALVSAGLKYSYAVCMCVFKVDPGVPKKLLLTRPVKPVSSVTESHIQDYAPIRECVRTVFDARKPKHKKYKGRHKHTYTQTLYIYPHLLLLPSPPTPTFSSLILFFSVFSVGWFSSPLQSFFLLSPHSFHFKLFPCLFPLPCSLFFPIPPCLPPVFSPSTCSHFSSWLIFSFYPCLLVYRYRLL